MKLLDIESLLVMLEFDSRVRDMRDVHICDDLDAKFESIITDSLVYYNEIEQEFEQADDEIKHIIISTCAFNTFNEYKETVAKESVRVYYTSIYEDMLLYATLYHLKNEMNIDCIAESLLNDITYYINAYEYSTLQELMFDVNIL